MTYDEKCYELALVFLSDHPHINTDAMADELASVIQDTIEDFIKFKLDNYEPPDDPIAWSGGFAANH